MNSLITTIVPAHNEEKNILLTIDNLLSTFKEFNLNGEIIVINDGSVDSTPQLVERKIKENPGLIRMITHDERKGIGASFWDGVDNAGGDFVVMIPGDNENDPREILRYHELLKEVDIIIPFIFNREIRPLFRNIFSYFFRFVVNATFLTNFNYTNGTTIYRRSVLKELKYRDNGFFFQTDILVRTIKKGYLFAEVPSRLDLRKTGRSKIISFAVALEMIKGYLRLIRDYYFLNKEKKEQGKFSSDSMTDIRKNKKLTI